MAHRGSGRFLAERRSESEFEDAVILKTFGDVPEDLRQV
jgi:hypothetical protein